MATTPQRLLPAVTPETEAFWTGGAHGELRILRCRTCGHWIHPPAPVCPVDLSRDVGPEAVSGRGTVHSVTVNHQPWNPDVPTPYAIVLVELEEQPGLRLVSNLVGAAPEDVRIGMAVMVRFEDAGEGIHVPVFEPASPGEPA
jgi:uncharacterized OB-fold protein